MRRVTGLSGYARYSLNQPRLPTKSQLFWSGIHARSLIGCLCLAVAQLGLPGDASAPWHHFMWTDLPFMLLGIAGVCVVPGLWLSSLTSLSEAAAARLICYIGSSLAWYSLLAVLLNGLVRVPAWGSGLRPTAAVILGVTLVATGAGSSGSLLAELNRPKDRRVQVLAAAALGSLWVLLGILAVGIVSPGPVSRALVHSGYVLVSTGLGLSVGGNLLARVPTHRSPHEWHGAGRIAISLAVLLGTCAVILGGSRAWPTSQRWPSVLTGEQVADPRNWTLVFKLSDYGPGEPVPPSAATFAALDSFGRRLPASITLSNEDWPKSPVYLTVALPPVVEHAVCQGHAGTSAKVTLTDKASGLLTQAVVPSEWCLQ